MATRENRDRQGKTTWTINLRFSKARYELDMQSEWRQRVAQCIHDQDACNTN